MPDLSDLPAPDPQVSITASSTGPQPDTDAVLHAAQRRLTRRSRGFWWAVVGMVGYVLLIVVLRLVWGWAADWRLAHEIEQRRSQGQPVLLEDFARPAVEDRDNAALLYQQTLLGWPTTLNTDVGVMLEYGWRRQEWLQAQDLMPAFLARHQAMLEQVTAATALEQVDWKLKMVSPVFSILLPTLSDYRRLAKLIVLDALDAHYRGDPARMLQRFDELFTLAQRLPIGQSFLIVELVQHAMQGLVLSAIERNAYAFDLKASPAVRAAAEALIVRLLDEEALHESYRQAVYFEAAGVIDTCKYIAANPRKGMAMLGIGAGGTFGWSYQLFFGPAMFMDCADAMGYFTAMANTPFNQTPLLTFNDFDSDASLAGAIAHYYANLMLPSLDRVHTLTGRLIARRRMAAIALAMRLYELDHGQRPAWLEQLTPEYLPSVPRDPFDPNDASLHYLADVDDPRLYSVDQNHVDDGGEYEKWREGSVLNEPRDLVFFLNESPRFRPPDPNDDYFKLPETLEDDVEVE